MYILALIGIICTFVGSFYSLRLIKIIYYHPNKPSWEYSKQINKECAILLGLVVIFILFFFFYPSLLYIITHSISLALSF